MTVAARSTGERWRAGDMVTSNHYTATWPQSPFVAQPVLVRKDEHQVRRLLGRQPCHTRPGAATQQWQLTDSRFAAALHDLRPGPRPGPMSRL